MMLVVDSGPNESKASATRSTRFRPGSRRVLIIVQDLPLPYDRRTWLEATTLAEAGYLVSAICPKAKGFDKSFESLEGVHVYRYRLPYEARGLLSYVFEFSWCFLWAVILSVRIQLFGRGFDVIHACNPPETYWLLGFAWGVFGKRFLFDHHDLSPEMYEAKFKKRGGLLYQILLWLEKRSFATAHTVICTNQSYKQIACNRGGVSLDRVFIVRSGPDTKRLKLRTPDPALKRGRRFLCVYLGKMCEQDGVDYLIRAIKILTADRSRVDIFFAFLGGGPAQPAVVRYAKELGVSDHCFFSGYVSDGEICRYLSAADIAVDPDPKSEWSDKSTMNKMMEYMFFGCPIVAFDLKENRFSAQAAAAYVTPNSEEEMADTIVSLLGNQDKRRFMRDYGKARVRSLLLWENSIPQLLEAYEHLFQGSPSLCSSQAHSGGSIAR
ncbi:MAG TPA: glycosyltransferase family 4 protein [Candidatus Binatia bacterium]|nr:glycosyltransferase family 4 protein [Candidatus Binatia bacterium]